VIVESRYLGKSAIVGGLSDGQVALATNTLREATFFHGVLGHPLLFREGLAALHSVVVSDFKYRPRDRVEFRAWLEAQDRKFLASLGVKTEAMRQKIHASEARLAELDALRDLRLKPFYSARAKYFEYVFEHQYELNYLLDPVITVHPDEVSFEAFSRDESSYARLAAKRDLFERVDAYECGTTNIDFSDRLHVELDRMRSYKTTRFDVGPSGLAVASSGGSVHKEKKIDLPDSWVMGFLQVQSTMSLGLTKLTLAPIDLYNICRFLRTHKARTSPRAMRFELVPDQRARVVFEPWEHVIELSPTAVYRGPKPQSVRTWGRDRLRTLARLLPVCSRVDVYLAGFGLPTIYTLDLGRLTFTLALSGWTDNDWTGEKGKGRFDLLARRLSVTADELSAVYTALRSTRFATDTEIAARTSLGVEKSRSALSHLCQVGRAMFDLPGGVYRHRELFLEPFTMKEAKAAVISKAAATSEEKTATQILESGDVRIIARRPVSTGFKLSGSAKGPDGSRRRPLLEVDKEGRVVDGTCTCAFFEKHRLTKGPCEHLLALRLAHMSRLAAEDVGDAGEKGDA